MMALPVFFALVIRGPALLCANAGQGEPVRCHRLAAGRTYTPDRPSRHDGRSRRARALDEARRGR